MAKVEIQLNSAGIQELLKSAEIASVCEEQAAKMTRATGVEYVPDVRVGRSRVNAIGVSAKTNLDIFTKNKRARQHTIKGYYYTNKYRKVVRIRKKPKEKEND